MEQSFAEESIKPVTRCKADMIRKRKAKRKICMIIKDNSMDRKPYQLLNNYSV